MSCSINGRGNAVVSKQYSNYRLVSGNWVPTTILLERFEAGSNRLLARDLWDITAIDSNIPQADSFDVEYETDALIEYASSVTDKPAMYRYSDSVDTDQLLADRLAYAASEGTQQQNCATAALKYAAGRLGKEVADSQLAELVTGPTGNTSLLAVKQFAEGLGLYCRAVTANVDTLRALDGCEAILYIPGKNHFVVLDDIDESYVRVIDLASNKFYYRTDVGLFGMDWTEGTALLISNNAVAGEFTEIDDSELGNIIGASGYSCTRFLQEYNVIYCEYYLGECDGYLRVYEQRLGCECAESGSCSMTVLIRYRKCFCIEDPYDPYACKGTYDWKVYYMRACA
jgi:hypothetical protein